MAVATTATFFTLDFSVDNVNWLNYYTSQAAELEYVPIALTNTVKYVRLQAAQVVVSGTDIVSLLLSSGGYKDRYV